MITGFLVPHNTKILQQDYLAMCLSLRQDGFGDCKLKLKHTQNGSEFYVTSGIHSLCFDCFDAVKFASHIYKSRLIGSGEHVMPSKLTVNQTLHYLDACQMKFGHGDETDAPLLFSLQTIGKK